MSAFAKPKGAVMEAIVDPLEKTSPAHVQDSHGSRERSLAPGPLRILHVINYLGRGGTELAAIKVSDHLEGSGFESRFCAIRGFDPEMASSRVKAENLLVAAPNENRFSLSVFTLMRMMKAWKPHIVHSRNWGAIEALPAARMAGVPVAIHSEHGYELDMFPGIPMRRKLARRIAFRFADVVFTVSRELRDYHARQIGLSAERIHVIYNGVDAQRFAPRSAMRLALRRNLGIPETSFVAGTVGRMVPIKDQGTLLKAGAALARQGVNIHVLLVGSGSEMEKHKQIVAGLSELNGRVSFLGALDNVADALNAMDAFVLPSIAEGMSNTVLEAMASGLPVVVTPVGGNPEVVKEDVSGRFFSPGDVAGLAEILKKLAQDGDLRARLGVGARNEVLARFTVEQMIANYRNMYLEAADRRGLLGSAKA
jgi:sugar transferase (PEP-CTERM/EpsH1 system associated)